MILEAELAELPLTIAESKVATTLSSKTSSTSKVE